jgi:hypothetical protein
MTGNQHLQYDKDDRRALLASLVASGLSLNEMNRLYGFDYRTVRRAYPHYKPFQRGGGGDAAIIRQVNVQLREFERRGKIGKHKDAGFVRRDDI